MKKISIKDRLEKIEASLDAANRIERFDEKIKNITPTQRNVMNEIFNDIYEGLDNCKPDIAFQAIDGEPFIDEGHNENKDRVTPKECMSRPPEGWHVGRAKTDIYEGCTGILETGYWYAGGLEKTPYHYLFWGFVWRGKWTFGVGRVVHDNNKYDYQESVWPVC